MLTSKTSNLLLIAGLIGFIVMTISQMLQGGDNQSTAESVAWAASNDDWKWIMPIRLLAVIFMLIFTVGFTSWARNFNESSGLINVGVHFTLIGLVLLWVSIISQVAGFDIASDSTEPAAAAHALAKLSGMTGFLGGVSFAFSLFLIGIKLCIDKVGILALNALIALLGIIAVVGGLIGMWMVWVVCFGVSLLLLAFIGIRGVMNAE